MFVDSPVIRLFISASILLLMLTSSSGSDAQCMENVGRLSFADGLGINPELCNHLARLVVSKGPRQPILQVILSLGLSPLLFFSILGADPIAVGTSHCWLVLLRLKYTTSYRLCYLYIVLLGCHVQTYKNKEKIFLGVVA